MKNKEFFYQQYNKLSWKNQEKTKLNYSINEFIINNVIAKKRGDSLRVFDMGFGVGFFLRQLHYRLGKRTLFLSGCEPSKKNYKYFVDKYKKFLKKGKLKVYNKGFLESPPKDKFDFITSIYVFPHFTSDDLPRTAKKIHSMLKKDGKFILTVANEKYIKDKLKSKRDLFIEKNIITFNGRKYEEILHYSELPEIGTIIDYNREEKYYLEIFKKNKFKLIMKKDLNDKGFIGTLFIFEKK